jgi:hypothetical protein
MEWEGNRRTEVRTSETSPIHIIRPPGPPRVQPHRTFPEDLVNPSTPDAHLHGGMQVGALLAAGTTLRHGFTEKA